MLTETRKVYQAELERLEKVYQAELERLELERLENAYSEAKIKADLELRSCTYDSGKWRRLANKAHRLAMQIDLLKTPDMFEAPHHD